MGKQHHYTLEIKWTGNRGTGTSYYLDYDRSHTISIQNKKDLFCSSDAAFRGDHTKHNPEDFLLSAVSSCHMLWYLHLCADAGVIVHEYTDKPTGILQEKDGGGGHFTEITLHPLVIVSEESMIEKANELHKKANEFCFISNSCNFPIHHQSICKVLEK